MSVTITSRSSRRSDRLVVTLSNEEYAVLLTRYGSAERARIEILNDAGRIEGHRRTLAQFAAQQLTDEQRRQIEDLAAAYAREHQLQTWLLDNGYGNYLSRAERGGMMPESWARITEQAREATASEPLEITNYDRGRAMHDLGLLTEGDQEWSESIARAGETWKIERVSAEAQPPTRSTIMSTTNTITAKWDRTEQYVAIAPSGDEWYSGDGDEWLTGDGRAVETEEFEAATIELCGGPRDGETVR